MVIQVCLYQGRKRKCRPRTADGMFYLVDLLFRVMGAGRGGLGRLAIFEATFVAQLTAFRCLLLAIGRRAMLVGFFLHKASGFLDLALNAPRVLQRGGSTRCKL